MAAVASVPDPDALVYIQIPFETIVFSHVEIVVLVALVVERVHVDAVVG